MSLKLAASVTVVQTVTGVIFSFLSIKVTSVYLGPAGLGTLGQLAYFMTMTQAILAAGVGTGLVRRTAELGSDFSARALAISTVLRSLILVGILFALIVAAASLWIARDFLNDARIQFPLLIFALVSIFGLVTTIIVSCANGAKDFRTIAVVNISSGAASLAMMVVLAPRFGLMGALFALAMLPVATFGVAWLVSRGKEWWPVQPLSHGFSATELRGVTSFVPLAIINSVGAPLLQLLIRDEVVAQSGMASVGLLQGVMKISDMYVGLAGGVLAMYFFPRFCEIRKANEFRSEVTRAVFFIAPAGLALGVAIYVFRELIVRLIFTRDFLPMIELFGWQMVGNTLKILGWPLAFALLAKANTIVYATFEVATLLVWWMLSIYFVSRNGAMGATQAFALTYAIYAVVALFGIQQVKNNMLDRTKSKAVG